MDAELDNTEWKVTGDRMTVDEDLLRLCRSQANEKREKMEENFFSIVILYSARHKYLR